MSNMMQNDWDQRCWWNYVFSKCRAATENSMLKSHSILYCRIPCFHPSTNTLFFTLYLSTLILHRRSIDIYYSISILDDFFSLHGFWLAGREAFRQSITKFVNSCRRIFFAWQMIITACWVKFREARRLVFSTYFRRRFSESLQTLPINSVW